MAAWLDQLDANGRRTLIACFAGWALDALDAQIYTLVIPILIGVWGMTKGEAGLLATVTLVLSAIGGWAAGLIADRIGRVRTLQITIAWFAFFTFLSGLTVSYPQLLVTRGLQGLGFGGEWAAGSVLIAEAVPARHRGKAVGLVQSAWAVGWGAAVILSTAFQSLLPPALAWRALFLVGLLPGLAVFFVRRAVPEPATYTKAQAAPHLLTIFSPRFLSLTLRGALLAVGAQAGYYAITTWLPTLLSTERHLSVVGAGGYLGVVIAGSFCGYIASAYLNDLLGRRATFLIFAVGSLAIVLSYTRLPLTNAILLPLGFPLGFFASGIFSGLGPLFSEIFPTEIRGSGQGFCYNAGRGLAALMPAVVGWASARMPLSEAIGLFAGLAYGLVVVATLLLPETRGRELSSLAGG
jgi:MFS family permease